MKCIKVVRDGEVIAEYIDVKLVETKWIDEFDWYGRVIHLSNGDTATFKVPVELYEQSNIGLVRI